MLRRLLWFCHRLRSLDENQHLFPTDRISLAKRTSYCYPLPLRGHILIRQHSQDGTITHELKIAQPHHGEVAPDDARDSDLTVGELAGIGDDVSYGLVSKIMQA